MRVVALRGYHCFVPVLAAYLAYAGVNVVYRSTHRSSIFEVDSSLEKEPSVPFLGGPSAGGESKLRLQDFHRVEVKGGRPVWEIRAVDAKYYPGEAVMHVNEALVLVYRDDGSTVELTSRGARLYLDGDSIAKLHLEGEISLEIGESVEVITEHAAYDADSSIINAPGKVLVRSDGFTVEGIGLEMDSGKESIRIGRQVRSVFRRGAVVPPGFKGFGS